MEELKDILKRLGIAPSSGYGETVFVWDNGEIVHIETLNRQLPKYVN